MATKRVDFKVTGTAATYWIAVDDQDVPLVNGISSIELEQTSGHVLFWWMIGNPGQSLSIVGVRGTKPVVTVKESKITQSGSGAGYRKFIV